MPTLKNRLLIAVVGVASLASNALPAAAGDGAWTPRGPEGGRIETVLVAPSQPATLYASALLSGAGAFVSTNAAASWTSSEQGLIGSTGGVVLRSLAIHPSDPQRAWAGTAAPAATVFQTRDAGRSWRRTGSAPGDASGASAGLSVSALAVDPSNPNVVWAGTAATVAGTSAGIFRSSDGGETWSARNTGFLDASGLGWSVNQLLIDPLNPNRLWATATAGGIYRTVDGGDTWTAAVTGLPSSVSNISELVLDPAAPSTLFAFRTSNPRGLWKSVDGAASWQPSGSGLVEPTGSTPTFVDVAVIPGSLAAFAVTTSGRLFASGDGGVTWSARDHGLAFQSFHDLTYAAGRLYAASEDGVVVSDDFGGSWRHANNGLTAHAVSRLLVDPRAPTRVYANSNRYLLSTDGGTHFVDRSDELAAGQFGPAQALSYISAAGSGNKLYGIDGNGGITTSDDGGATWSSVPTVGDQFELAYNPLIVAADPEDSSRLVAGLFGPNSTPNDRGLYLSTDGGLNLRKVWTPDPALLNFQPQDVAVDPTNPNRIVYAIHQRYTTAFNDGVVLRSEDRGETFASVLTGIAFPTVTIDSAGTIWVAGGELSTRGGVWRSRDHGTTWQSASGGLNLPTAIASLAVDPLTPDTVYAAINNAPWVTYDGGDSWHRFDDFGRSPAARVRELAVLPTTPREILAGTNRGVWAYRDGCTAQGNALCLVDGRFQVTVDWRNQFSGASGKAKALPSSGLTGFFAFEDPANVELMVKIIDFGTGVKIFYGQLTNLEFTIHVRDNRTGAVKHYSNLGNLADTCGDFDNDGFPSLIDLNAFDKASSSPLASGNCVEAGNRLCLQGGRYAVEVDWHNQYNGQRGFGTADRRSDLAGTWSFTDPQNVELLTKLLDFDGRLLFIWGVLSDLEYTIRLTNTATGQVLSYHNPPGTYCGGFEDDVFKRRKPRGR